MIRNTLLLGIPGFIVVWMVGCSDVSRDNPDKTIAGWEGISSSSADDDPSSSSSSFSGEGYDWDACVADTTCGTFEDYRDGSVYYWTQIGNRIWMGNNLMYGTGISGDVEPSDPLIPEYYCYDDKGSNCSRLRGGLYKWSEAMGFSDSCNRVDCSSQVNTPYHQGACPEDWHVATKEEWDDLISLAGGIRRAGYVLKYHLEWSDGEEGSDSLGFSAIPTGERVFNMLQDKRYYDWDGEYATYWMADPSLENDSTSWNVSVEGISDSLLVDQFYYRDNGYAVRCVYDVSD